MTKEELTPALDDLIKAGAPLQEVADALIESTIYAYGLIDHTDADEEITGARFVSFNVPGSDELYVPVFTSEQAATAALESVSDWAGLPLLSSSGEDLLDELPRPVIVAINPWTDAETLLALDED